MALHAEVLLKRDRDYIVRNGIVELIDEFTGRVADNRRWPHGIQPAIEAKEGVDIRPEGRILNAITIQHFVHMYPKIAGMTATAVSSSSEFRDFYGLDTVIVPPHRSCIRHDEPDAVFTHLEAKVRALVDEIRGIHATGRPILVGTASVHESEELAARLRSECVKCRVLNAKHDAREALIIACAGRLGAVTISTNMAGRGTDIVLGGGDEFERQKVVELGGLYVIGTNRYESVRIDHQLRGRAGRQGDPGSTRFFISLEDDLMCRYDVTGFIPTRHRPSGQQGRIHDRVVLQEIARAQRIIESQNFEIRRTLWSYSELVEKQRQIVHRLRQGILAGDIQPGLCADAWPDHFRELCDNAGRETAEKVERLLTIHYLDCFWSEHLAVIDDIREGIHFERYGGREPLDEFIRQADAALSEMMQQVETEVVGAFGKLPADISALDLEKACIRRPSATWTYIVGDNPFSRFGSSLIASRNIGFASWTGLVAFLYMPLALLALAWIRMRQVFFKPHRAVADKRE